MRSPEDRNFVLEVNIAHPDTATSHSMRAPASGHFRQPRSLKRDAADDDPDRWSLGSGDSPHAPRTFPHVNHAQTDPRRDPSRRRPARRPLRDRELRRQPDADGMGVRTGAPLARGGALDPPGALVQEVPRSKAPPL